ncbi:MAG TPA: hypothetical protein VG268_04805 [Streptosporangiaceae bacterium]|jgi:hypothetical protein|nr:hypothetical protein [Streptosporangiaceae bacterium]
MRPRPWTVVVAAAAQALEAVGVLLAAVLTAVDTASGRSYEQSSGIALTILAFAAAVAVAFVVRGILQLRMWSRTPTLLTQLFVGTTGVYLVEGHRLAWGIPALVVAIAGFIGLCVPPSWRALSRLGLQEREEIAAQAQARAEAEEAAAKAAARASARKKAPTRRR